MTGLRNGTNLRAPIRYFGGKWRIADWIIDRLPPHRCYVELCGGGGICDAAQSPRRDRCLQ